MKGCHSISLVLILSTMAYAQTEQRDLILGGGCFWCLEAAFERIEGVLDVQSGYAGGNVANPTYEQVCSCRTNHAEVVRVLYDPKKISEEQLLDWFWKMHDPTTLNRQGADVGTQYRSILFYEDESQKKRFESSRNLAQPRFTSPIVTQIVPRTEFYPAEEYHQDYFRKNPYAGYCQVVIRPKLIKLGLR